MRRTLPGGTGLSREQARRRARRTSAASARSNVSPSKTLAPARRRGSASWMLERLVGARATRIAGPERAGAGVDLRLRQVERVRALDVAGRDVVADRDAGDVAVRRRGRAPISGSGTFQVESARMPIGSPGPTVRRQRRVLQEELRPLGLVDERVDVLAPRSPRPARRASARTSLPRTRPRAARAARSSSYGSGSWSVSASSGSIAAPLAVTTTPSSTTPFSMPFGPRTPDVAQRQ